MNRKQNKIINLCIGERLEKFKKFESLNKSLEKIYP